MARNGTHIHWSFVDGDGNLSFTMRDVDGNFPRWAVTSLPGILHHLPCFVRSNRGVGDSYYRLRPDRWAPVKADLGL